jgi:hypothetical protein
VKGFLAYFLFRSYATAAGKFLKREIEQPNKKHKENTMKNIEVAMEIKCTSCCSCFASSYGKRKRTFKKSR